MIPLLGLNHRVDIFRLSESDDGSGGIETDANSKIYASLPARITTMSDKDEQELFGRVSGQRWRVISKYAANINRGNVLFVSPSSLAAPIPKRTKFYVIYVKHQIDHAGRFHHTSMIVSLEPADT